MNLKICSAFAVLTFLLGACSAPKNIAYFQGIDSLTPQQMEQMSQSYSSMIYPDDLLTITVTSPDPTVVTPFNPPAYAYGAQNETNAIASQQLFTYLVNNEGFIIFPVIGKIKAAGSSKQELAENIRKEVASYVPDAQVNVQITNFKITVLGEVARPGLVTMRNDRISILDALGQAGDLTINAERNNILVIRDNNGEKEFARMDITDPAIFTSPYYYLRQNDVVYVEPNGAKKKNSRYSQAQQYNVTIFSTILSTISVITTVILAVRSSKK